MVLARAVILSAVFLSTPACAQGNADTLLAQSRAAERTGNTTAAIRLAQSAIVADPLHTTSYVTLGDLYLRADQSDFAGFYYAEALEIEPDNKDALKGMAEADAHNRQTAAAAGSLDKAKT